MNTRCKKLRHTENERNSNQFIGALSVGLSPASGAAPRSVSVLGLLLFVCFWAPQPLQGGCCCCASAILAQHFWQNHCWNCTFSLFVARPRLRPHPEQGGYKHHSQMKWRVCFFVFAISSIAAAPNGTAFFAKNITLLTFWELTFFAEPSFGIFVHEHAGCKIVVCQLLSPAGAHAVIFLVLQVSLLHGVRSIAFCTYD